MKANGIRSKVKRKWKATTDSKHRYPVAENVLNREFNPEEPDTCYVSDITYIWTQEGWLYLSIVMDLYSRMIVGWSMSERLHADIIVDAINMAYNRRNPMPGALFHSDRGVQYASENVRRKLAAYGFISSMSRKGNCYDNACAESFFHTLKGELVNFEHYRTREEARNSIFSYIEVFYNRIRKHSTLGYKSPAQFEELKCLNRIPA
jgi:putative transposase